MPQRKRKSRPPSLQDLITKGALSEGAKLTIKYKQVIFEAELLETGEILYQSRRFLSPSSWSIHVKRSLNPERKADDGWRSVRCQGKSLKVILDSVTGVVSSETKPRPRPLKSRVKAKPSAKVSLARLTTAVITTSDNKVHQKRKSVGSVSLGPPPPPPPPPGHTFINTMPLQATPLTYPQMQLPSPYMHGHAHPYYVPPGQRAFMPTAQSQSPLMAITLSTGSQPVEMAKLAQYGSSLSMNVGLHSPGFQPGVLANHAIHPGIPPPPVAQSSTNKAGQGPGTPTSVNVLKSETKQPQRAVGQYPILPVAQPLQSVHQYHSMMNSTVTHPSLPMQHYPMHIPFQTGVPAAPTLVRPEHSPLPHLVRAYPVPNPVVKTAEVNAPHAATGGNATPEKRVTENGVDGAKDVRMEEAPQPSNGDCDDIIMSDVQLHTPEHSVPLPATGPTNQISDRREDVPFTSSSMRTVMGKAVTPLIQVVNSTAIRTNASATPVMAVSAPLTGMSTVTRMANVTASAVVTPVVTGINTIPGTGRATSPVTGFHPLSMVGIPTMSVTGLARVPVTRVNAVPVSGIPTVPVTAFNSVPASRINAARVTSMSKVPVTEIKTTSATVMNAEPVTATNSVSVTSVTTVPVTAMTDIPVVSGGATSVVKHGTLTTVKRKKPAAKKHRSGPESESDGDFKLSGSDSDEENVDSNNTIPNSQNEYLANRPKRARREVTYGDYKIVDQHPLTLLECISYGSEQAGEKKDPPYSTKVSNDALLFMDFHAHMASTEIIGLLAGTYNFETKELHVKSAFPCRTLNNSNDSFNVEMDPESEVEVRALIKKASLSVVGWYHSHPHFAPKPSLRDVENQGNYQKMFETIPDASQPFLGAIVAPYNYREQSSVSVVSWFRVEPDEEDMEGHDMPMAIHPEYTDAEMTTVPEATRERLWELIETYSRFNKRAVIDIKWRVDGAKVIDKLMKSIRARLPSKMSSDDVRAFEEDVRTRIRRAWAAYTPESPKSVKTPSES
eukprot:127255_1